MHFDDRVAVVRVAAWQYYLDHGAAAVGVHVHSLDTVIQAVRRGNNDVGGRLVEISGREYMVRGRGYVKSVRDLESLVLRTENGTPITVKDVAQVTLGPEMRRGVADLDGQGDVVAGIVEELQLIRKQYGDDSACGEF